MKYARVRKIYFLVIPQVIFRSSPVAFSTTSPVITKFALCHRLIRVLQRCNLLITSQHYSILSKANSKKKTEIEMYNCNSINYETSSWRFLRHAAYASYLLFRRRVITLSDRRELKTRSLVSHTKEDRRTGSQNVCAEESTRGPGLYRASRTCPSSRCAAR